MATPNFSKFRLGDPLALEEGGHITYEKLESAGLQDYYIRIIYSQISKGKLDKTQLDDWLSRARSGDKVAGRVLRAELENLQPKAPVPVKNKPVKAATKKRVSREKMFTLHSKSNHKQAIKLAEEYHLTPVPLPKSALRPGQSEEAHSVQANSQIASKLITSGNWSTTD